MARRFAGITDTNYRRNAFCRQENSAKNSGAK
jgi:hypothetical protein